MRFTRQIVCTALRGVVLACFIITSTAGEALLNVSYDSTREMFTELNRAFAADWKTQTGETILVRQSHGGSGKQGRAVLEGLRADVVTLALAHDIDVLANRAHLLPVDWQKSLPNNSCPFTSTVVFLVRKGNPLGLSDWGDLARPGVEVVTPNPKTSGGARWNYLAAYGYALEKFGGDEAQARRFMAKLLANIPILDSGARGATMSFLKRGIGDVLLAWESEALLAVHESGGSVEIVYPSVSILAEPPVALVERNVRRKGTEIPARAYLDFLYSAKGQQIVKDHYFRPMDGGEGFPAMRLFTVEQLFGSWEAAHRAHFAEGGLFDQLFMERFK